MIKPCLFTKAPVFFLTPASYGYQDSFAHAGQLTERTSHIVPSHARKSDIEQHNLGYVDRGGFESAGPIVTGMNVIAYESKKHGETLSRVFVVVNDKDSTRFRLSCAIRTLLFFLHPYTAERYPVIEP